eukprot:scaffold135864_cov21-Prasinocladus_malaysianus.AAC.1
MSEKYGRRDHVRTDLATDIYTHTAPQLQCPTLDAGDAAVLRQSNNNSHSTPGNGHQMIAKHQRIHYVRPSEKPDDTWKDPRNNPHVAQ